MQFVRKWLKILNVLPQRKNYVSVLARELARIAKNWKRAGMTLEKYFFAKGAQQTSWRLNWHKRLKKKS